MKPANPERRPRPIKGIGLLLIVVLLLAGGALLYALAGDSARVEIGQPAPAFKVHTLDGLRIDSLSLRGSVIVVNFFASWCKPCQEEAADLQTLWEEFSSRDVVFVGIAYQDVDSKITEFVRKYGLTFPVANSSENIGRRFGITGVPETYVIGRDGLLVKKFIGPIEINRLRQTLNAAVQ